MRQQDDSSRLLSLSPRKQLKQNGQRSKIEIQHRGAQIVERVNGYFGHRMIDDIRLVQGALAQKPAAPVLPQPDAQAMERIVKAAGPVKFRPSAPDSFNALARSIVYQQLAGIKVPVPHAEDEDIEPKKIGQTAGQ